MAIDFPAFPSVGQTYTYAGVTYTYTATGVWAVTTGTVPPTTPQGVGFRANKNGVNQSYTANVETKLTFTTEESDVGGYYDAPNSRWTPPAGLVHIYGQVHCSGIGDNGTYYLALYKNGAVIKRGQIGPSNTADVVQINVDDTASGSDVYELYIFFNTATPVATGTTTMTYWGGHVVGATQTVQVTTGIGVTTGVVLQKFTASGTYTPTPGLQFALVECIGGGGAGGGNTNGSPTYVASGGGGGGYSRKLLTAAQIGASQSITVGAGGVGSSGNGTSGGDTFIGSSFGSLCGARGGSGGLQAWGASTNVSGGAGGAPGIGDVVAGGNGGGSGVYNNATGTGAGLGAPGPFGGGAPGAQSAVANSPGIAAQNYGGGGSGAMNVATGANTGGNGSSGIVIITEYVTVPLTSIPQGEAPVIRGWIDGLTLAWVSNTSFSVAPGLASDSTNVSMISLGSSLTKTTAVWAAGTGVGGLDTGAIAINTWYHVYVIRRNDGVTDVVYSTSVVTPLLPSGYTKFRRIGSVRTNASSQFIAFSQYGDEFLWAVPVQDVSALSIGTTALTPTLTVPTGVKVYALMRAGVNCATGASLLLNSPDENVIAVGINRTIGMALNGVAAWSQASVRTNTSAQVRAVGDVASSTYYISTYGWIDPRGRSA